jgi:hypothetical protein
LFAVAGATMPGALLKAWKLELSHGRQLALQGFMVNLSSTMDHPAQACVEP